MREPVSDTMKTVILALGSNIGDGPAHLRQAITAIAALEKVQRVRQSSLYRTPPWGKTDQDWFTNAALVIRTLLPPMALLEACLRIEAQQGRIRQERWGPRVIDIDMITYEGVTSTDPRLTLPHPAAHERAFVLLPLCEIAPGTLLKGKTAEEWLAGVDQSGIVQQKA